MNDIRGALPTKPTKSMHQLRKLGMTMAYLGGVNIELETRLEFKGSDPLN